MTTHEYERPRADRGLLRLHLNENTAGCSPAVLEALRTLTATDVSTYPDYDTVQEEAARYFGVAPGELLLVNGLDEGILAAALAAARTVSPAFMPEAVVILPAFDMYSSCSDAAGLRVTEVAPGDDLTFPLDRVLDSMSPATRIVFLTTPGNPTGEPLPFEFIAHVRDRLPPDAILFVDEAYVGFGEPSLLPRLKGGNIVIGRTFSKTHGIAGVRAGALLAEAAVIREISRVVPPYSLNTFAVAAVPAAVRDTEYVAWYAREVATSRQLLLAMCERLGLFCWRSAANFVLVRVGERSSLLVRKLAERGIVVRDRGNEPGCSGCVRITAGVVEHTRRLVEAMEEVLCGAR